MKTTGLVVWMICFSVFRCVAQDSTEVLIHIPDRGKSISDFIPKGYHNIMSAKGDFNKDGKEDKAIVVEEAIARYRKYPGFNRILLILFKTKTGWDLAGRSDSIMQPADVNNDPMIQMDAKGNTLDVLQITYSHGILSNFKNLFRYQDNNFYLVRRTVDSSSIQVKCDALNEYRNKKYEDINFVTGERIRKRISYYCELLIDKKDTIEVKPLLKISEAKPE